MLRNSWHMVLAEKCLPFWLRNKGCAASVVRSHCAYSTNCVLSAVLTNTVRVRAPLVCSAASENCVRGAPSASYTSPMRSAANSFALSPVYKLNNSMVLSRVTYLRVWHHRSARLIWASLSVAACAIVASNIMFSYVNTKAWYSVWATT